MAMLRTPPNSDALQMGQALALARQMRGHIWPNPPVGCVIVRDRVVMAEGAKQPSGRSHAERVALDQAGASAADSTSYVTMEPCCHWGRTPPCADAIIAAGVARVVAAMQDPNPRVNGVGFRRLRAAEFAVPVGEGETEARAVMSGFLHRTRTGEPERILSDSAMKEVPEGVDALLESRHGMRALRLHSLQQSPGEAIDVGRYGLLRRLGSIGLTSVAPWRNDFFVR